MTGKTPYKVLFAALAAAFVLGALSGVAQNLPKKKLIEFGWDVPSPEFVRDHIRGMETRPFEGIIFRTKEYNHAFDTRPWTNAVFKPDMEALAAIKWGKFTDNFLTLYAANNWKMNWFDDSQWTVIEANMRLFSKAAKAGKCVGVCFDNEPYGDDPWVFTGKYPGKSFDEVAAKVRARGAQFMRALQSSTPDMKVLHFFQLSYYGDTIEETHNYRKETRPDLLNEPDPARRNELLSTRWLALFEPFFIGMLEAAGPNVTFIDGNEFAYYYDSPDDFFRHYHQMKVSALTLVPEPFRRKHFERVQAGNAVYYDILAAEKWGNSFKKFVPSNFMTMDERLRYLEHNVYWSLFTTDEYVWFYSENMNWWKAVAAPGREYGPKIDVPAGIEEAVVSARTKIERGRPLGFEVTEPVARGWQKVDESYKAQDAKK